MRRVQKFFLLLICLLGLIITSICNTSLYAQDISNSKKLQCGWLNLGMGLSGGGFFSVGGSVSYLTGRNLFSIRCIYSEKLYIFGYGGEMERGYDLGVLYGGIAKGKYSFISLSVGIGFVSRVKEKEDFFSIGIPIEGQLFLKPLPYLGFGIYPFANPTLKGTFFGGLLLCVQIGKLR